MPRFFSDEQIASIIKGHLDRDGYFVTCYKAQKRIGEVFKISPTSDLGQCLILGVSTREEAMRQIIASGLDPADFSLEYLFFYRAKPLPGALQSTQRDRRYAQ